MFLESTQVSSAVVVPSCLSGPKGMAAPPASALLPSENPPPLLFPLPSLPPPRFPITIVKDCLFFLVFLFVVL